MDEGVALIVCCYAEAAKIDLSPEELRSQLRDAGLTDGQIEAICNVYKVRRRGDPNRGGVYAGSFAKDIGRGLMHARGQILTT